MIRLRPYTTQDAIKLSLTIDSVCTNVPWMATNTFVPTDEWFHALHKPKCPNHYLVVVESNNDIVGWSRLFPLKCNDFEREVELGIGLLPDYRGQGIGSKLVRKSLEWAKVKKMQKVSLTVSLGNKIAIRVFEKHGFESTNILDNEMLMSAKIQHLPISAEILKGAYFEKLEIAHL